MGVTMEYTHDRTRVLPSPKLEHRDKAWLNFYAGYSITFVSHVLSELALKKDAVVADPWNGTGITTLGAYQIGLKSIGLDLNPAMVEIARGRCLNSNAMDAIKRFTSRISKIRSSKAASDDDSLLMWFTPKSADIIRNLSNAIHRIRNLPARGFIYTALFKAVRKMCKKYITSNPTWVKWKDNNRISVDSVKMNMLFEDELLQLASQINSHKMIKDNVIPEICIANSINSPLNSSLPSRK